MHTGHLHHALYQLATAYALLEDKEKALTALNYVADNGFPNYPFFKDDPLLVSLHDYPPYNELLNRLKITWTTMKQIAQEKVE